MWTVPIKTTMRFSPQSYRRPGFASVVAALSWSFWQPLRQELTSLLWPKPIEVLVLSRHDYGGASYFQTIDDKEEAVSCICVQSVESLLTVHLSRFEFSFAILERISLAIEESTIDWARSNSERRAGNGSSLNARRLNSSWTRVIS